MRKWHKKLFDKYKICHNDTVNVSSVKTLKVLLQHLFSVVGCPGVLASNFKKQGKKKVYLDLRCSSELSILVLKVLDMEQL